MAISTMAWIGCQEVFPIFGKKNPLTGNLKLVTHIAMYTKIKTNKIIRSFRAYIGMTRSQLAGELGRNPRTIYNWEHGISSPSKKNWDDIVEMAPEFFERFYGPAFRP